MHKPILSRRTFLKLIGTSALALGVAPHMLKAQGDPLTGLVCPIMMYHYISAPPEDAPRTLRDLTVLPENFVQQLDSLLASGFTTITMRDMWAGMQGAITLPEKPIVLTFDDGYWDAFAHAAPALLERGMTGTFYVVSSFMNQAGYLTWEQARIMHSQGLEIGGILLPMAICRVRHGQRRKRKSSQAQTLSKPKSERVPSLSVIPLADRRISHGRY